MQTWYPKDRELISRVSIIEETPEKSVRMANLATIGSHAVNGVAALHTELLKKGVLKDFYKLFPEKFLNKTNGVTPRRWILLSNPKLSALFSEKLGDSWLRNLDKLRQLEKYVDDVEFCKRWQQIKQENKVRLAEYILKYNRIEVDTNSLFDIQVKRIHEYKRQHLDLFHIITLYNRIKQNPSINIQPRTFIFGGKAAPGYYLSLIHF